MNIRKHITLPFVLFLTLSLPAIVSISWLIETMFSMEAYYSQLLLAFRWNPIGITFIPVFFMCGVILCGMTRFIRLRERKFLRIFLYILLACVIISVSALSAMVAVFSSRHFSIGDSYCNSTIISELERCEGFDRGMLQDRISAIARFGTAVSNIEEMVMTYPKFSMKETDCKNLPGQFGQKCYEGEFLRPTNDTNFLGVYISGEKVLVIETENIVLTSSQKESIFLPESRPVLSDFVDVNRFADDMKSP